MSDEKFASIDQSGAGLFADQNKDAGGQRYNVEQKNRWPEIQAEP
jgi:hypothetical protein